MDNFSSMCSLQFKTIPTQRWPCITNTSYSSSQCISRCFLAALYSHTGCLMPYMHGKDNINDKPNLT